jgi:hypothetical protein
MAMYLLLIHENEDAFDAASDEAKEAHFAIHLAFQKNNQAAIVDTKPLDSTKKAKYLRKNGRGGYSVTDGVYAETKEALGGYYLVEAEDMAAAIALAEQLPGFGDSAVIQVRPVYEGD